MAEEQIEDLRVTETPDGAAVIGGETPPRGIADVEDETRLTSSDNDDEDEQGHAAETEDEKAERTKRNRERRQQQKEFKKQQLETLRRELAARDAVINEMSGRLAVVERKSTGSEMAQLQAAEQEAVRYYNHFKQVNQQAIEQANGAVATEAQEKMFAARQRLEQIANVKKAMTQQTETPQPLDPRLQTNAEAWLAKNAWYNPSSGDEDSAIVLALDNRLAQEGWDPRTPQYWDELDSRVKKYLPHRQNSGYNRGQGTGKTTQQRSPVAGSGRESSNQSSGGYTISPERVQALKDAGIWDDPKARAEAVKRFQQYDKEQRT